MGTDSPGSAYPRPQLESAETWGEAGTPVAPVLLLGNGGLGLMTASDPLPEPAPAVLIAIGQGMLIVMVRYSRS
ncbi:MAG: hypothetical protein ABI383_11460 [Acidobacteriaceae bacterium]